ncbi:MAG TPA: four helix bundle protein [Gemmatimonadaceae bacterium]|nr:four helix bundle protein [Gemmatimonadaceae bacterium]
MGNHRDLQVWQRSHDLAARVDVESRRFLKGNAELADQLRRAAMSVPTNLAEGSSKGRDGEFGRFINIAIGSAAEADSLLLHAEKVGALSPRVSAELLDELTVIRKMLFKLRRAIAPASAVREAYEEEPEPEAYSPEPRGRETG